MRSFNKHFALHPAISQFLIAAIFLLLIAKSWNLIAQTALINQL